MTMSRQGPVPGERARTEQQRDQSCLLSTSDAADERSSVDLGGRRIIKKKYLSLFFVFFRLLITLYYPPPTLAHVFLLLRRLLAS